MKPFFIFIIVLFFSTSIFAQNKQITYGNQVWFGYYPQIRLSKNLGLWSDYELQQKQDIVDESQFTFRLAGNYYLNNDTKLTAGYTYINVSPTAGHLYVSQPENAAWEQIQWYTLYKKKKLMQWIRLEERFKRNIIDDHTLADNSTYTWRARYNFFYQLPLSSKGVTAHHVSTIVGDELYINFGKNIVNNYFDQNRIFLGAGYMVNSHDNLVIGYMNLFQQLAAGDQYKNLDVFRISFYQTINLTKHKTTD